jgi:hypothetical protein
MGLIFSPERLTGDILSILNMLAKRKGMERWKTQHKNTSQRQVIMFMVGQNERWILAPMAPQNRWRKGRREAVGGGQRHPFMPDHMPLLCPALQCKRSHMDGALFLFFSIYIVSKDTLLFICIYIRFTNLCHLITCYS